VLDRELTDGRLLLSRAEDVVAEEAGVTRLLARRQVGQRTRGVTVGDGGHVSLDERGRVRGCHRCRCLHVFRPGLREPPHGSRGHGRDHDDATHDAGDRPGSEASLLLRLLLGVAARGARCRALPVSVVVPLPRRILARRRRLLPLAGVGTLTGVLPLALVRPRPLVRPVPGVLPLALVRTLPLAVALVRTLRLVLRRLAVRRLLLTVGLLLPTVGPLSRWPLWAALRGPRRSRRARLRTSLVATPVSLIVLTPLSRRLPRLGPARRRWLRRGTWPLACRRRFRHRRSLRWRRTLRRIRRWYLPRLVAVGCAAVVTVLLTHVRAPS